MIIGLTGPNASGKGEVAKYIGSKGYTLYSLSDVLREESNARGLEPIRENLIKLGNALRSEYGPSVLAKRVARKVSKDKNYIVDSIRNPAEVEELRKLSGFFLIGISAPVELRLKRIVERKRPGDPKTLKDLIEKEKRENIKKATNQQLDKCLELADTVIINDSSKEALYTKIDEEIKKRQ